MIPEFDENSMIVLDKKLNIEVKYSHQTNPSAITEWILLNYFSGIESKIKKALLL